MKHLICFRASINGTEKGKRKEGYACPKLFDVPLEGLELVTKGQAPRGSDEDAQFAAFEVHKQRARLALHTLVDKFYRGDKPLQASLCATQAEENEEDGQTIRVEELRPFVRWEV